MTAAKSSGAALARLVASVPASIDADTVRSRIGAYYASYPTDDSSSREALFADPCRFEDPAGIVMATDRDSLHRFFHEVIPADWHFTFRLERVAVVGNEALSTATMRLRVGDRPPVDVLVNAHFQFTEAGLIRSVRTFFDEQSIRDAADMSADTGRF